MSPVAGRTRKFAVASAISNLLRQKGGCFAGVQGWVDPSKPSKLPPISASARRRAPAAKATPETPIPRTSLGCSRATPSGPNRKMTALLAPRKGVTSGGRFGHCGEPYELVSDPGVHRGELPQKSGAKAC